MNNFSSNPRSREIRQVMSSTLSTHNLPGRMSTSGSSGSGVESIRERIGRIGSASTLTRESARESNHQKAPESARFVGLFRQTFPNLVVLGVSEGEVKIGTPWIWDVAVPVGPPVILTKKRGKPRGLSVNKGNRDKVILDD